MSNRADEWNRYAAEVNAVIEPLLDEYLVVADKAAWLADVWGNLTADQSRALFAAIERNAQEVK